MELFRHGAPVEGVLDLLGSHEVAHTTALGWTLAAAPGFAAEFIANLAGRAWTPTQVLLERRGEGDASRTDIELRGERAGEHLIIEAKLGLSLPASRQLDGYDRRLDHGGMLAVISHHPAITARPATSDGHPVVYRMWRDVLDLAAGRASQHASSRTERRHVAEFYRYLEKGVAMPGPAARVWVVPLRPGPVIDTKAGLTAPFTWIDVVQAHDRYFHPAASKKFPSPPNLPNYLGFRYGGRLQRISHVDSWDVIDNISAYLPGAPEGMLASDAPLVIYRLGPPVVPAHPVPSGKVYGPGRNWADLDLLLVGPTVADAIRATRTRADPRISWRQN